MTLSTLLTDFGTFTTAIIDIVGDWLAVVTSNPILEVFVILVPLVGIGIGLIRRLLGL